MRRVVMLILAVVIVSLCCYGFDVTEYGVHINLNRLTKRSTETGRWHASVEVYVQQELDAVWRMESGLGYDFADSSPFASVGFLRSLMEEMYVEADFVLQWVPRHGFVGAVNTGMRYHPMIADRTRLILEAYPVQWGFVSVNHRYSLLPVISPSFKVGLVMLLEHGGFFGETVTIAAQKVERRLPFSLFIGNDYYLTAGQLTTVIGYRT
ncbi:hypothetical protein IH601_06465 [Candidatus Bipolaricaulota bacterium]|jgi:hypothetical protein|nr:hypothetical protein [Candidatus Bipolaricaulota bacterium]TFH08330.1 MAG: hypothetical protein E4H08_07990 [Candidatus Atribacteria bacterium]